MRTFQRIIDVPGISNFGIVADNKVYRAAQPNILSSLADMGIKSILNLRKEEEREAVEAAGMKYFQLRLTVFSDVTTDDLDLVVQTLSNPDNQPILVHCLQGHDRTGIACAAYRMVVDEWTYDEAWEETKEYGFNGLWFSLKQHLINYAKAKGFE